MVAIGDVVTVTYEQSKQLRKEGWRPRNDVVVMMFVGGPEKPKAPLKRVPSDPDKLSQNRKAINSRNWRAKRVWSPEQHAFVARKLAEASV